MFNQGALIAGGLVTVLVLGMGLVVKNQQTQIGELNKVIEVERARNRAANATIKLLRAEIESDAKVDDLTDDELRNVPADWLFPGAGPK